MALAATAEIRTHFPALQRMHGSFPVAYFDGPGGTQVPSSVPIAIADYLFHRNSNANWPFPTSAETDRIRHQARKAMADFLGGKPEEIVFGANMTTLTYHLSRALGAEMGPGDELVVTELDHHGNVDPWKALEDERGVRVRTLPMVPETGTLDLSHFPELLNDRTRLVALGAASNILGTVTDIPPLAQMAKAVGAKVFVDAVHLAPHRRIQVEDMGCDFLACSPYKFYGPHMGVLWIRSELLETMQVPKVAPAPKTGPGRFESGTVNSEGMAGTTAAVEFLCSLAIPDLGSREEKLDAVFSALQEREGVLFERLWRGLADHPRVHLYGPPPSEDRAPTLSFTVEGTPAREVSARLADESGAFLSHGDFYAATVVDRLGLRPHGMVRAGVGIYTTEEEVDRVVEGVRRIASEGRG
ncbi:MAG: cysteine desulfurase-like protein [Gemmatimonadetes bacterium]|nr:cysteine desulfurase-like protein [Gemmatimonadota bacterium]